jgi:hypothetical protein
MKRSIWIGFDPRESAAYTVATRSIAAHSPAVRSGEITINRLDLKRLRAQGLYWRAHIDHSEAGKPPLLYDVISQAPMSTEFAISRFATPALAEHGLALFMDCDVMARCDIAELFETADPRYAVQCVQHDQPQGHYTKMDGQAQLAYARKNWSSVCLFRCDHPANAALDITAVNTLPGRDLHRFCWLPDQTIGALPGRWNHLVGIDPPAPDAAVAHFTLGIPLMAGYEDSEHADEWRSWL